MNRVALWVVLWGGSALANGVGYAQATGYHKKDTRPTLYQPLNLLDGRDATAYCTTNADPLNDTLTFGLKAPATVTEIHITTGNNFDEHTFKEFARARKLSIKVPGGLQTLAPGVTLPLEDKRGPQVVKLSAPLTGQRFVVEIQDQYPTEDPEMPVCLTDFIFYADGKPLSGAWLTTKLKYDRGMAAVMGTWFAGSEGHPNTFLAFDFDGQFRFSFEPVDAQREQPRTLEGKYDASNERITFEVPDKPKVTARLKKEKAPKGRGFTLSFEGDVPAELKRSFRSVP